MAQEEKKSRFHRDLNRIQKIYRDDNYKWMGSFKILRQRPTMSRRKVAPFDSMDSRRKTGPRKLKRIRKLGIMKNQYFKSSRFEKYRLKRSRTKRSPHRLIDKDLESYSVKQMDGMKLIRSQADLSPISKVSLRFSISNDLVFQPFEAVD